MPATLNCPSCGAPLEVQAGEKLVRCRFCGSQVTVPEAAAEAPLAGVLPAGMDFQKIMRLKEVKELARQGKTGQATALYQELTGSGPEAAGQAVAAMAAGRPVILSSTTTSQQSFSVDDPSEVIDEIKRFFGDSPDAGDKPAGK